MDFGEPSPDIIARLYKEIKEKKVSKRKLVLLKRMIEYFQILELDWKNPGKKNRNKKQKVDTHVNSVKSDESSNSKNEDNKYE